MTGKDKKGEIHSRKKYSDHSQSFMNWVNILGLEKSFFGRLFYNFENRWGGKKLFLVFVFSLVLSFLIFLEIGGFSVPRLGKVASEDIKSPVSFDFTDQKATNKKIEEAQQNTPLVFDENDVYEGVYSRLYASFREMRSLYVEEEWTSNEEDKEIKIKNFFRHKVEFEKSLGVEIPNRTFEWLIRKKFSPMVENIIRRSLEKWSMNKIYDGSGEIVTDTDKRIILRNLKLTSDEYTIDSKFLLDIRKKSQFNLQGIEGIERFKPRDKGHLLKVAHSLQVANLTFNKEESLKRRTKAKEQVLPVKFSINKNQMIVTAGTEVQESHVALAQHIKSLQSGSRYIGKSLMTAILLLLLTLVLFSYLRRFTNFKLSVESKDLWLMGTIVIIMVLITKVFIYVGEAALMDKFDGSLPGSFLLYASPFAAGAMAAGLLLVAGELVWIFSLYVAVVMSLMMGMDLSILLVCAVSGVAGARGVYKCEKRNDIYWAGLRTGLVSAAIVGVLTSLAHMGEAEWFSEFIWNSSAALVGGLFSAMIVMMITPLLESLFSATTDLSLLELSNLNHPLMKEMLVKCPGTYQHCMAVGNMCDAAANAIGANALLAKVMAYYHDIGKMEHSHYFIENQRPGYNPHDNVSPFMSKTILVAHVKDGAEMGIKHNLGKPIIDGILQHHGTSLISYFYNKALAEENAEEASVSFENEFRYPGPKPQFKEAALVMLADGIEAAARSIDTLTAARLSSLVENIIKNKFIDGQLEECNITLRELSTIEQAFKTSLLSIYHHRIEYPHMKDGQIIGDAKAWNKKMKKKKNKKKAQDS